MQDTFDPFADWATMLPPDLVALPGGGEGSESHDRPDLRLIDGGRE